MQRVLVSLCLSNHRETLYSFIFFLIQYTWWQVGNVVEHMGDYIYVMCLNIHTVTSLISLCIHAESKQWAIQRITILDGLFTLICGQVLQVELLWGVYMRFRVENVQSLKWVFSLTDIFTFFPLERFFNQFSQGWQKSNSIICKK